MTNNDKYLGGKQTSKLLGVHQRTLYQWEKKGLIKTVRTPGGKRMYYVDRYLRDNNKDMKENDDIDKEGKLNLSYVRVSSLGQKNDLERQKDMIKKKYPNHVMIEDIGSGINLNKKGIKKIIKLAIE